MYTTCLTNGGNLIWVSEQENMLTELEHRANIYNDSNNHIGGKVIVHRFCKGSKAKDTADKEVEQPLVLAIFWSKWAWSKEPGSHCFCLWRTLNVHVKDDLKPNSSWDRYQWLQAPSIMSISTWLSVMKKEREDILHAYRMLGTCSHFCGWLGSHKILPTMMGMTKNMAAWPVLASKSSYCHPASSVH